MDKLITTLKQESRYDEVKDEIAGLEKSVKLTKEQMLKRDSGTIKTFLEEEIVNRYYFERGQIESILRNDYQVKKALDVKLIY